jgi:dihydropteroate synthase
MTIRIAEISSLDEALAIVARTGADLYSVPIMAAKGVLRAVELDGVDNRAANLLKQEMLSLGAEAAVSHVISRFEKGCSTVLLLGTLSQFSRLLPRLSRQPFGLKDILKQISLALCNYDTKIFKLVAGKKKIALGETPLLMGILNVTTDSFSDGGRYNNVDGAVEHGIAMVRAGAGIIDVGGQSTRPGAKTVSAKDEAARIVPVIRALAKKIRAPISVDTFQPEVAKAALDVGATIINDITALRFKGGAMASLAARRKTPVVLMHMQGTPAAMQENPQYKDVVSEITEFFEERIKFAVDKGIARDQIILDPGIGFGKTVEHNLIILRHLREFTVSGRPLLVGLSNKSFIGKIAGVENPADRLSGSLCGGLWSAINGAAILRVHDVPATAQAIKILSAIRNSNNVA